MGFVHDEDELLRTHSTRVETPNPVAARFLSLHTGPAMSMCIHWTLSSTNCNKGGTQSAIHAVTTTLEVCLVKVFTIVADS